MGPTEAGWVEGSINSFAAGAPTLKSAVLTSSSHVLRGYYISFQISVFQMYSALKTVSGNAHLQEVWHFRHEQKIFRHPKFLWQLKILLRGAWRDRDTNDIFPHCSLIFYFLDLKFSNFVCPSVFHRLIWFFLKKSFRKKKNIWKTTQNALAPSIFIVLSIALKLGTPLLHTQAQNTLLQIF